MAPALDPVHRALAQFLREHRVTRTTRLLAAVSGGSDSVALLHALLALGQRVGVAHVHHGLRGAEAERELEFVARLATQLGVTFHVARVDARARDGRSPEARARALRYEALERMRVAGGYASLVTAHQRDDQAETLLLRAVRGTGPAGLAGVRPSLDGGRVLRPLLAVGRAELAEYLVRRGHAFVCDSSNADRAIPRNRLRAEVLPVLEQIAPGAVSRLAALAELARAAEDTERPALDALLARGLDAGEGGLWLEVALLAPCEAPLRRRLLARWCARAGRGERVTRAELERIDAFLRSSHAGQRLALAGGHALYRDRSRAWLGPESGPAFPAPVERSLAPGESLEFPERRLRLSWCHAPSPDLAPGPHRLLVPPALERCTVRSPRDEDRIQVHGRERRLKDVLAGARWSKLERARALVVEGEGVLWVPGLIATAAEHAREARGSEIRAVRLSMPLETC